MAGEVRPEIIFLDLSMPDLSGFEVLPRLRANPVTSDIPVIIVTSLVLSDTESRSLAQQDVTIVRKDSLEQTDFVGFSGPWYLRERPRRSELRDCIMAERPMESILNVDDYAPGRYAAHAHTPAGRLIVQEAPRGKKRWKWRHPYAAPHSARRKSAGHQWHRGLPPHTPGSKTFSATILHISASNVQTHHQVAGLEGGADSYLVEPIEPDVLIATVKAFFRARQAEDALRRSNEELERSATAWLTI